METPHPPETAEFGAVRPGGPPHVYPGEEPAVTKISVGGFDNNVYVVRSGRHALIVDGAAEPGQILSLVDGLDVVGIAQTHGHFDHVQALKELVETLGCPVWAHPADAGRMPVATEPVDDGDSIRVGAHSLSVLHTPGHTPGSICLTVGGYLFSGDTLFPAGPGNTEGDPARFAEIMRHVETRLLSLRDGTRICPGHGLDTFVERERPYLAAWRERGW